MQYDSVHLTQSLFVDGRLEAGPVGTNGVGTLIEAGNSVCIGAFAYGTSCNNEQFDGTIADVSIFERDLSPIEIAQMYRRGSNRLRYQIKTCADSTCSQPTDTWKGPDGSDQTYFSDLYNTLNNTIGLAVQTASATLTFTNFLPSLLIRPDEFFQYRLVMESDDVGTSCNYGGGSNSTWCSPELQSISLGAVSPTPASPSISNSVQLNFSTLFNFSETLGSAGCPLGVVYNLSNDNSHWYYWNGNQWSPANGTPAQASSALTVNANLTKILSEIGQGSFYFKAFLQTDGDNPCQLSSVSISGTN